MEDIQNYPIFSQQTGVGVLTFEQATFWQVENCRASTISKNL